MLDVDFFCVKDTPMPGKRHTVNFAQVDFAQVELSPISNIFDSPNLFCVFSMVCFSHKSKWNSNFAYLKYILEPQGDQTCVKSFA